MKKAGYFLSSLFLGLFLFAFSSNVSSQSISVVTPDGIAQWQKGTARIISWTKTGFTDNVWIELWKGGAKVSGANGDINVNASGLSYSYSIPAGLANGSDYTIKVFALNQSPAWSVVGESPQFQIVTAALPFISVISPTQYDSWQAGSSYTITWDDNLTSFIQMDLYNSGGHVLSLGSTDVSFYSWNIPANLPTGSYYIKLVNVSDPGNTFATSGTFHVVANAGTVTSVLPSGGTIQRGQNQTITWTQTFTENVNVYYCDASDVDGDHGTLISGNVYGQVTNWYIPNDMALGNYKIKVRSVLYDNATEHDVAGKFCLSASSFQIVPKGGTGTGSITFTRPTQTAPLTGWQRNTLQPITWNQVNFLDNVEIHLIYPDLTDELIADNVYGWQYNWFIPSARVVGTYTLRIIGKNGSAPASDVQFNITDVNNTNPPSITWYAPAAPDGSTTWPAGTLQHIAWYKNFAENVDIYVCNDQIGTHDVLIRHDHYGMEFIWFIPTDGSIRSGVHYVKIVALNEHGDAFYSSAFNINGPAGGSLTVTYPVDATPVARGTISHIDWTRTNTPDAVRIELWKGGNFIDVIKTQQYGTTCDWWVPTYLAAPATDYQIKVISELDPANSNTGTAFTIAIYKKKFGVYPNPADNNFNVTFDEGSTGSYNMVMYNRFGEKVMTSMLNTDDSSMPSVSTTNLPNGIYYLVLTSGDTKITQSVIVQH